MEARLARAALVVAAFLSLGASYRTQNFIVSTHSSQLAAEIGEAAEAYRRDLAIEWLGRELPNWRSPCPITVEASPDKGAGGATTFSFDGQRRPFGWTMSIQGSRERLLDSVLPHEITHTIFATHFGRPLPRWADEGACTTVEHENERGKQHQLLIHFLTSRPSKGIPFNKMFPMMQYPRDMLPLYAQGYSVARFLIGYGGKRKFVEYIGDGMNSSDWDAATKKHYGFKDLSELQVTWLSWVASGSPSDRPQPQTLLVSNTDTPKTDDPFVQRGSRADHEAENAPAHDDDELIRVAPERAIPFDRVARNDSGDGWYSRQQALQSQRGENEDAVRGAEADDDAFAGAYSPGSIKNAQPLSQIVSRPQPIGRPQPRVLEWSRSAEPLVPVTPPSDAVRSSSGVTYDTRVIESGTYRR